MLKELGTCVSPPQSGMLPPPQLRHPQLSKENSAFQAQFSPETPLNNPPPPPWTSAIFFPAVLCTLLRSELLSFSSAVNFRFFWFRGGLYFIPCEETRHSLKNYVRRTLRPLSPPPHLSSVYGSCLTTLSLQTRGMMPLFFPKRTRQSLPFNHFPSFAPISFFFIGNCSLAEILRPDSIYF